MVALLPGSVLRSSSRTGVRVGVEELELALELPDVVELAVHGRESHVCDAVERTEKPQCSLADERRVDLGEARGREARPRPRSSAARHPRARSAAWRSRARGRAGASVGRTAGGGRRACDPQHGLLDTLERRMPCTALEALAPSANGLATVRDARLEHTGLAVADRAHHARASTSGHRRPPPAFRAPTRSSVRPPPSTPEMVPGGSDGRENGAAMRAGAGLGARAVRAAAQDRARDAREDEQDRKHAEDDHGDGQVTRVRGRESIEHRGCRRRAEQRHVPRVRRRSAAARATGARTDIARVVTATADGRGSGRRELRRRVVVVCWCAWGVRGVSLLVTGCEATAASRTRSASLRFAALMIESMSE